MTPRLCAAILAAALVLPGCAKRAEDIPAAYVSPLAYQDYSCEQLQVEAERLSQRSSAAMNQQDSRAKRDAVATGVGVVLFWPALFFIKGGGASEAEVARLKGEMEALESASNRKNCGFVFRGA